MENRSIVSIADYGKEKIQYLLDMAAEFEAHPNRQLLKGKVKSIVLAGFPKEMVETYKGYGIDEFIHVKTNVLESLTNFQKQLL